MIDVLDIQPGERYGCKFRTVTMLNDQGEPATGSPGDSFPGPGVYESIGIIQTRDLENQKVKLIDTVSRLTFVVSFDDIWDIDTIEVIGDES